MTIKLFAAAAIAALSLGAGAAQAQTAADSAVEQTRVSFYFGVNPYYTPYYYQPYYYQPVCYYNRFGYYVCR